MPTLRETFQGLKPVIYVLWLVAATRLLLDATSRDPNVYAAFGVYSASAALFIFCGLTGHLDGLGWKGWFKGALVLTVLCWFIPNSISYSVANFQGWDHGRFEVDEEFWATYDRFREEGLGVFEAFGRAEEEQPNTGRTGPPWDMPGGKVLAGTFVGLMSSIAGFLWCLLAGLILVGIPSAVRRRRGTAPGT